MNRGFSLIEILVVLGLAGLLALIGFAASIGSYQRYVFSAERDLLVTLLQSARSQAMANVNQETHGLRVDVDNFVLLEGGVEVTSIPRTKSVTISGSDDDTVIFDRLSGDADNEESFSMTGPRILDASEIAVSENGKIDWNWN